jgi:uncharacterized integral membrane protein
MKKSFNKINLTPMQVLYFILLVLLIVFIVQNMESVMVKFLFFGFKMPLIIIIIVVFIAGILTSKVFKKKIKEVYNEMDEKLNS